MIYIAAGIVSVFKQKPLKLIFITYVCTYLSSRFIKLFLFCFDVAQNLLDISVFRPQFFLFNCLPVNIANTKASSVNID